MDRISDIKIEDRGREVCVICVGKGGGGLIRRYWDENCINYPTRRDTDTSRFRRVTGRYDETVGDEIYKMSCIPIEGRPRNCDAV